MRVLGKNKLIKLKKKNKGNKPLCAEIDKLVEDLEGFNPQNTKLSDVRKDADCVHNDGFYFFNISVHRSLVLVDFDDDGEATIVWAGSHDDYERIFKNNKPSIEKWLRKNGHIE
ncbi:addiction module toxin RelE [Chitinophaga alhagiae]|uniref:Addiction module toxin RelE n=1 Tax=Chitinophaga alhagiae TaxID=2203219 RepID=A0ABN5LSL8_9BACT|nr:type II toxin-antitoxin system HigB family toxin [Chitinophaga alhagiae]AWO00730.1 addiction module toxin RelE [Chitinophaga alhagiae]